MKRGVLLLMAALPMLAAASVPPLFSIHGLNGWETHGFMDRPHTRYQVENDDGTKVIAASCDNQASGLIWRGTVDLTRTPILSWRWKINRIYAGIDEQRKSGDDFPARVYVTIGTAWLPWTLRSLSYVWGNGSAKPVKRGQGGIGFWPSPYTSQAEMVAVRTGDQGVGQWQSERRNVRADFKTAFGKNVVSIGAVAIMTDCDDSHNHAKAWYGDLRFSAPEKSKAEP